MCIPPALKPYAPPTSKAPNDTGEQVPSWMVSQVLEQRHSRRVIKRAKQSYGTPASDLSTPAVGTETLGGDSGG